jgi:hypothetical protein
MDHAVAVGAQHRKVRRDVIPHWLSFLQSPNGLEVVRFDEPFSDWSLAFYKLQIASLTSGAVKLLGVL